MGGCKTKWANLYEDMKECKKLSGLEAPPPPRPKAWYLMAVMLFMTDFLIKHGNMSSSLEDSSFKQSNTDSLHGDPQTLKELLELETEISIKPPPESVHKKA
jgi:hypothetical protein